ncbi:MAG: protein kinase [Planctomycetaceae bacterium]|nr:protein kinase [Planctomycetaceae bacterium]
MAPKTPRTIYFRGRNEEILERISVLKRNYFVLEKLSARGVFRVFDPEAGPQGNYRLLYRIPQSLMTREKIDLWNRLSGSQKNRNFPALLDFGKADSDFILVTEWIEGTNLRDYLEAVRNRDTPRPTPREVVRLIRGLVHGVAHYYRRTQLVHGDISPANLILTTGTSQLIVIDFGSAWPIETGDRVETTEGITIPYAAPERLHPDAPVDFRADFFSVAVVAYEMLTLTIPYAGLGGQAGLPMLIKKTATAYHPPSTIISHAGRLPRQTIQFMDDCLSQSLRLVPEERYATLADWLSAWDQLHHSFQKGSRLRRIDEWILGGLNRLLRLLGR